MGTADGSVVGVTKIVDRGPDSARWNLVLVAEGYQQADLTQFATDAQSFVNHLFSLAPFDRLAAGINVHRLDVSSTDRGADDPAAAGGTGVTANTYFDATFGAGNIRRALVVNDLLVMQTLNAQVPAWHMALVIVNSTIYGGTGGQIGVFSLAASANEIGVHEMGHTAFGLADEYEYWAGCGVDTNRNHHPAGEPDEPNVTLNSNRDTIKWRDLIAAATPMPTMSNPNCANCDGRASTVAAGTVGAFEGAHYYHCGAFRPEHNCKMRALGQDFCAVCERTIEGVLQPFIGPGWHHSDLTAATAAPAPSGMVRGYMFDAQGTQHVIFRSADGHVQELWWDSAGWHHSQLTLAAGAPVASGSPAGYMFDAQGTQHVVYRGQDGRAHELWWGPSGWHHSDLTGATGAPPPAGDLAGYMFDAQGTQHVVYRSADGHVHELWWDAAGWHHSELTNATGAPVAATDPFGYMFDAQGTQHVVYAGQDGHVHELWWDTTGWHHSELTNATGAPVARGRVTGYMFDAQGTQHVIYRGPSGKVHELWWDAAGWHHSDLTLASGAPVADGDVAGYMFDAQGTQHVVYRSDNGDVHELWWDASGWHHSDLTAATGAPRSATAPFGYMFDAQGTQHVVYRGVDGRVHELWWG